MVKRALLALALLGSGCETPPEGPPRNPAAPTPEETAAALEPAPLTFTIDRSTVREGYDGKTCWVHPRAGVDFGLLGNRVVLTAQQLDVSGSDLFQGLHQFTSSNGGARWNGPEAIPPFARRTYFPGIRITGAERARDLLKSGDETVVNDFSPKWHRASKRLLGTGQTVWYRDKRVLAARPRDISYAVYASRKKTWEPWQVLHLPAFERFKNAGAGSGQRHDLPNGDILLPIYFKEPAASSYQVTVCRCRFDGTTLSYVEHGNEMTVPEDRGLYEPSLTWFEGRYYLTLRNDRKGYVCTSEDGLQFNAPVPWTFDDGRELGNYNTQQHWVTHSEGLFLVYTRRGANNDHVFRHRAPLFIARVDPERLVVQRDSEQVLVPERGARLGNFGVTDVSPNETWVTVAEWMQPAGVEARGSDNRIIAARILWSRPNRMGY